MSAPNEKKVPENAFARCTYKMGTQPCTPQRPCIPCILSGTPHTFDFLRDDIIELMNTLHQLGFDDGRIGWRRDTTACRARDANGRAVVFSEMYMRGIRDGQRSSQLDYSITHGGNLPPYEEIRLLPPFFHRNVREHPEEAPSEEGEPPVKGNVPEEGEE